MTDPYLPDEPISDPQSFFGQSRILEEIAGYLCHNQSVSVVGPHGAGKTSLLIDLSRPEVRSRFGLGDDHLVAYLDCHMLRSSSHQQIFAQFCTELGAALRACGVEPESALEAGVAHPTRLSFESAVRRLNQRGMRVVLMLDDFEHVSANPRLELSFLNALRSAAGRYQLVYLTASARPLIDLTYFERDEKILSSPFFNIFVPLFLKAHDEG